MALSEHAAGVGLRFLLVLGAALAFAGAPADRATAQTQLIQNGNFESVVGDAPTGWTTSTSSSSFFVGSYTANPNPGYAPDSGFVIPLSGTRSLLMTQSSSSDGYAFQTLTLPAYISAATLTLRYSVNLQGSNVADQARADIVAHANVSNPTASLLNIFSFTNTTAVTTGTVTVDLKSFAGQTFDLRFFARGDSYPACWRSTTSA